MEWTEKPSHTAVPYGSLVSASSVFVLWILSFYHFLSTRYQFQAPGTLTCTLHSPYVHICKRLLAAFFKIQFYSCQCRLARKAVKYDSKIIYFKILLCFSDGLHHDEKVSPQHLPCGCRHTGHILTFLTLFHEFFIFVMMLVLIGYRAYVCFEVLQYI